MKVLVQIKTPRIEDDENDEYFSYSCPHRNSSEEVALSIVDSILENRRRFEVGSQINITVSKD